MCGSVSGGCVENDVAVQAREVIATGEPQAPELRDLRRPGAWRRPAVRRRDRRLRRAPRLSARRRPARSSRTATSARSLFTVVEGDRSSGAKLLVLLDRGETVGDDPLGLAALAPRSAATAMLELEGMKVFAEVFGPPPRLVVVGAVDTAEALCAAAEALGWRTICVDARAALRDPASGCRAPTRSSSSGPRRRSPGSARTATRRCVVLTHDEKFDIPALRPRSARRRSTSARSAAGGAGKAARAAARGRRHRGPARATAWPGRPRHRGREPRRDGGLDARRDASRCGPGASGGRCASRLRRIHVER